MDTTHEVNAPSSALVTVPFHGDGIVTFEANGEPHVAMRRIVENMGLGWASQTQKLNAKASTFNVTNIVTVDGAGRRIEMLSMPLRKLPLWLATINPNKVSDKLRPIVERYQEECAVALHDYWTKGVAVKGDLEGVLTDMTPDVRAMIGGIFKAVLTKGLSEIIPAMVEREISSRQFGVVSGVTAGKVLDMAGVTDRKGLKGLDRFVSNRLWRFHAEKGVPVRQAELGLRKAYLFQAEVCKEWLERTGNAMIEQRVKERRGQTVLRLVPGQK